MNLDRTDRSMNSNSGIFGLDSDHFERSSDDFHTVDVRPLRSDRSNSSITVHLIEKDVGLRAQIARRLLAAGYHAEIYAGISEFVAFAPKDGVILIDDANHPGGFLAMINEMDGVGAGMPVIVYCDKPTIAGVVAAMRARAVNYLSLDVTDDILSAALTEAAEEGDQKRTIVVQVANCGKMIKHLSPRERQVLDMLADGESNKGMARQLGLSPRTIEIHRMKLMGKLGAKTPAQAVKIWCAANLAA